MANGSTLTGTDGIYQAEGAARLRKTLRAAGDDLADLKMAHGMAGMIVAAEGVHAAPRRPGSNLLASTVRFGATKTSATIRAGNNTTVPYALPIHWGWPARNIRAQPWLTEAAQQTEPQWLPHYEQAITRAVNKIEGA